MNKIIVLTILLFSHNVLTAYSWSEILHKNSRLSGDPAFKIIFDQYKCFTSGSAPTIADPVIKRIPIVENNEPIVDIILENNPRISMLPNPLFEPFYAPHYNAGFPSASKIRAEVYCRLERLVSYLDKFALFFGHVPRSISIKVFEGLRDLKTQERLFQSKVEEIICTHKTEKQNQSSVDPDLTEEEETSESCSTLTQEEAELEAAKWVSPVKDNVPVHSTGAAIDVRLWDESTSDFLDLGDFGVIWGENKTAATFSEDLTDHQKLNRLFLLMAATKAGLTNYSFEYWHFSCGDRYAAFWQEEDASKRVAHYGSV